MKDPEVKTGSPRAVAGNVADVLHDVTELGELQVKLLVEDSKATAQRAVLSVIVIAVGICLVLGSIPVALTAIAQTIQQQTSLSAPLALTLSAGGALLLAIALLLTGWIRLRNSFNELDRSRQELARNMAWLKQSLKRKSQHSRHHVQEPTSI